jgi:excinuclease ABC subunit A
MQSQTKENTLLTEVDEYIEVIGAREHNLKNIDINIPRNKLVVITGLSGSGKSSLAFDTIYAEGQRRYIETFSAYARQFLGGLERPDVDKISGLSPVISIEQKTISRNPRSTVGTITEVYDFIRLLYARIGDAYSYNTGERMVRYNDEQITDVIMDAYDGEKLILLAPVIRGRKGHYRELFEQIARSGFVKVRIDGEVQDIEKGMRIDRYKIHDIEIVIDRVAVKQADKHRVLKSVQVALRHGKNSMMVMKSDGTDLRHMSRLLMCPTTGISYPEPDPNLFSFNSPYGACPSCNGLGEVAEIDPQKIIPDPKLSIEKGGIAPLGKGKTNWIFTQVNAILEKEGLSIQTPIKDIEERIINILLYGSDEMIQVKSETGARTQNVKYEGIIQFVSRQAEDSDSRAILMWARSFMNKKDCPTCEGTRLKKESLHFQLAEMSP